MDGYLLQKSKSTRLIFRWDNYQINIPLWEYPDLYSYYSTLVWHRRCFHATTWKRKSVQNSCTRRNNLLEWCPCMFLQGKEPIVLCGFSFLRSSVPQHNPSFRRTWLTEVLINKMMRDRPHHMNKNIRRTWYMLPVLNEILSNTSSHKTLFILYLTEQKGVLVTQNQRAHIPKTSFYNPTSNWNFCLPDQIKADLNKWSPATSVLVPSVGQKKCLNMKLWITFSIFESTGLLVTNQRPIMINTNIH